MMAGPAAPAHAQVAPWSLSWTTSQQAYDALERLPSGATFSRDTGMLRSQGLGLQHAWAGSNTTDGWRLGLGWEQGQGDMAYAGLSSAALPLVSRTQLRRQQLKLSLQRHFGPRSLGHGQLHWHLGVDLAAHRLQRRIEATPLSAALQETLTQHGGRLGGGVTWQPTDAGWQVLGTWHAGRPWHQRLVAQSAQALDPVTLRPRGGDSRERALGLAWRGRMAGQPLRVSLMHQVSSARVGDSAAVQATQAGQPLGTLRFPGNRSRLHGWQFSLTLHWPALDGV